MIGSARFSYEHIDIFTKETVARRDLGTGLYEEALSKPTRQLLLPPITISNVMYCHVSMLAWALMFYTVN